MATTGYVPLTKAHSPYSDNSIVPTEHIPSKKTRSAVRPRGLTGVFTTPVPLEQSETNDAFSHSIADALIKLSEK